jgi:hypothetical protein
MRRPLFFAVLILLPLSLSTAACNNLTPTPFDSPLPSIKTVVQTSPLSPTQPAPTPVVIPTSQPGYGTVRGTLVIAPEASVVVGEMFLAEAVKTSDPNIKMPALDIEHSPRAVFQRRTGEFVFVDVPPGEYGLIAWEPFSSILVNDPKTGNTLFILVEPDRVIELGELGVP